MTKEQYLIQQLGLMHLQIAVLIAERDELQAKLMKLNQKPE